MKRLILGILGAAFLTAGLTAPAAAQEASKPCAEEVQQYCKDVKPGGGRIYKCLEGHKDKLSAACQDHLVKVAREAKFLGTCGGDIRRFCADVTPGEGRLGDCLSKYRVELSTGCRMFFDK